MDCFSIFKNLFSLFVRLNINAFGSDLESSELYNVAAVKPPKTNYIESTLIGANTVRVHLGHSKNLLF